MIKPKLHPEERRWFHSSEYPVTWMTLLSILHSAFYGRTRAGIPLRVPPEILLIAICAVAAAYSWGRVLWKKNRGHFYSGWMTSEWQMWVSQFVASWALYLLCALDVRWFIGSLCWSAINYCLGRGFTKSIGTRNQMMMLR